MPTVTIWRNYYAVGLPLRHYS